MVKYLCSFILRVSGWKITGDFPEHEKKYITIVAPHNSNWDFILGVLVRGATGMKSKYLGKASLFKPPHGWIFRMLGGYPVDRSKRTNLVDQVVDIFNKHEEFRLAIAPEGTRKKVNEWKTGFYYMSVQAKVPIVRCVLDWPNKEIRFYKPFTPSGDIQKDMPEIRKAFNI